ncbi:MULTISPECIES: helix-turn-helix transcriptional regulator [Paraeggerthella]|uniref:helix-turn-helix transcriptional regulator n=2 Tax=Eggerthellaceae TaxID=1643826 RepID=UPI001CE3F813|nr:LuxR family transcriptional regulator [Paraeggerthella sp. Marseille-Q4926]MCD2433075.1 LuxR C-terminal-related transcriptional regulator [Paraeggerthella hominis]MDY3982150.1 LuxR C-terminal-related transcriptional regulator [Paraeggerthella sp.]
MFGEILMAKSDQTEQGNRPPGPLFPWMPAIPVFFLGLGVYRAWIEIVFVGSFISFPATGVASHDVFDLVMIATMFSCAALAKRIGPLFGRKSVYVLAGVALVLSTCCMFVSIGAPSLSVHMGLPAALLGGFGIALVILLWSELYSCLNPFRVALYYSASMMAAALLIYVCRGMSVSWLAVVVPAFPVVSLAWAAASFRSLPADELPSASATSFSFPWKIVLLMAIYAFAYGLKESSMYQSTFGPHSAFGTLAVAAIVFVGVIARGGKFDFAIIYRLTLPLMVAAFLILPNVGVLNQAMSDFCTSASYTAFSVLVMLIMANLSYRYGVSAVWLFGIERGVRALFSLLGRQTEMLLGSPTFGLAGSDAVLSGLVIVMVVAATMILFSEKELSSRWGMTFLAEYNAQADTALVKKQELANRCQALARERGLSPREEEVLLLLAQHKTVGSIERELFIANGTAKTHIRHIYRKLDVHSRDELINSLGLYE